MNCEDPQEMWMQRSYIHSTVDSAGDVSEEPVMQGKQKKGWRMSCYVGEAIEGLENEL